MMLVRTYVAQSEIQGLGVFAGEFVPAGRQLWVLNPKFDIFVHANEIPMLPAHMQDYVARYSYPHLEIDGVRIVDCDDGKFMNHSDRPNTDFHIFDRGPCARRHRRRRGDHLQLFRVRPGLQGLSREGGRNGDLGHAGGKLPGGSRHAALNAAPRNPARFAKSSRID